MRGRGLVASLAACVAVVIASGCPTQTADPAPRDRPARPTPAATAAASPAAAAEKGEVTLTWVAYFQNDIAMFEVYRSESPDGPWKNVTADRELIQGEGMTNEPKTYSFTDTELVPERQYYYYIGKVSLTGRKSRHTRVLKVRAHLQGEGTPIPDLEKSTQEMEPTSKPGSAASTPAATPAPVGSAAAVPRDGQR